MKELRKQTSNERMNKGRKEICEDGRKKERRRDSCLGR